jgi:pyruvate dehydrogenase E2 component (dihydrolipoamide acetyltransferase)
MAEEIVMPALGETSDELHIIEWLVAEGDQVELAQPLLVVETDKAEMEVESVAEGTLLRIVAAAGETVAALSVIAYIGTPGDELPANE